MFTTENRDIDKTHTKITNLEITQKFDQQLALLTLITSELDKEYSTVIDSTLLAKVKVLHPSVINPTQFITELTKTINRLPSGSEYPTPMELKNAHTLFDLSEINNLDQCKLISNTNYICKNKYPIYSTQAKSICETELILTQKVNQIPLDCDTRLTQITDEFWHKLNKTNEWICILSKPSRITLTCKNLSYPIDFELFGSGKIKLSVVTFFDNLPYLESNYNSILPNFNILHVDCCKKHSNLNIDEISIPKIHLNKLDLEELKVASHKLDDIARLSENLSKTDNTSRKNSVFSIIVQIVCGI
ncbi:hypothetical protein FQA39_LY00417 [Lamprigera yunnana]|nr:hypothetical protein FQA39_LY00417 [Lamprigera yunnana]